MENIGKIVRFEIFADNAKHFIWNESGLRMNAMVCAYKMPG